MQQVVAMEGASRNVEEDKRSIGDDTGRGLAGAQSVACGLRNIGDELWRVRSEHRRRQQHRPPPPQHRYTDMTALRNDLVLVKRVRSYFVQ